MVRSQEIRNTNTARSNASQSRPLLVAPTISVNTLAYIVTAILALLAIYAVMGNAMSWFRERYDDMRYGTTRTHQIQAVVGHGDSPESPSHFIAMNLNRQVVVIQLPGGDSSKIRTFTGPYLFGANEDKTPVLVRLDDLNRDGAKDLIVSIKNEEIIYLNRDGSFHTLTAEERAQLVGDN